MAHEGADCTVSAGDAMQKLIEGNRYYRERERGLGDVSGKIREETCRNGQHPFAIIVGCSDSRVIPEVIFQAGIGELFVIRVAGNVIDNHQLGSIEYAAEHLGCKLVVVLGHDRCGAVNAAIHNDPDGYIRYITDEIRSAIGGEREDEKACCLNIAHSVRVIERDLGIRRMEREDGLEVVGAIYRLQTGAVEFLPKTM